MRNNILILLVSILIFSSCTEYQKLLKSSDYEAKYAKAVVYYEKEDYVRAVTLFEELIPIYKGTPKGEEVYFYYAYCHYGKHEYMLASYYLQSFAKTYPISKHKEECVYLSAYCHYLNSPNASLDQTYTYKAIEELQLFINAYPNSDKVEKCNGLIDKLRSKLETKSYDSAKLYYNLGEYKAAITSLKNSVKDYPDSEYREELLYLTLKSSYLYAENSIEEKQKNRYENTIEEYYVLIDKIPNTKYLKEAQKIFDNTQKKLRQ